MSNNDLLTDLVREVAEKWKNTPAMIDALYEWCDNPTGTTMRGVSINLDYIMKNLKKRYPERDVVEVQEKSC